MLNILDIGNKIGKAKEKAEARYGGFQARLVAMTIDVCLSIFLLLPLMNLATALVFSGIDVGALHAQSEQSGDPLGTMIASGYLPHLLLERSIHVIIFMSAVLLCWMKWSATPGKLLLGLRIVDAKTLARPSRWQLVRRAVFYPLSLACFALGFAWIAVDKRKRGWHDRLAGTAVISKLKPLSVKEWFEKNKAPAEAETRPEKSRTDEPTS